MFTGRDDQLERLLWALEQAYIAHDDKKTAELDAAAVARFQELGLKAYRFEHRGVTYRPQSNSDLKIFFG